MAISIEELGKDHLGGKDREKEKEKDQEGSKELREVRRLARSQTLYFSFSRSALALTCSRARLALAHADFFHENKNESTSVYRLLEDWHLIETVSAVWSELLFPIG